MITINPDAELIAFQADVIEFLKQFTAGCDENKPETLDVWTVQALQLLKQIESK